MYNKVLQIDKIYFLILLVIVFQMFNHITLSARLPTRPFMFLSIFYIYVRCNGKITRIVRKCYFGKYMLGMLVGYCITTFFSYTYWNQSIYDSVMSNMPMLTIVLLYFYYNRINLSEESVIKTLVICTIIWTALEWIQQLTYPSYWFCGRFDEQTGYIEERMGLWRFYITGVHAAIFILIYYVYLFTQLPQNKKRNFLIWAIALIGIIGFVSRKQIYASILVSIIAFVLVKGKLRIFAILLLLAGSAYGIYSLADIMQDLNERTINELSSDDFIRTVATQHFLFEFSDSPIYYLFGTGMSSGHSTLESTYTYLQERYGFYTSDCGIVGYMAHYGCVNIILFLLPAIKVLLNWKKVLLWHKLYLLYYGIMLNIAFWGNSVLGFLSFVTYLYLVEKHLQRVQT